MKIATIGAGYFAEFQVEAWKRIREVELVAICDQNPKKSGDMAARHGVDRIYQDYREMLDKESPDVVDIITPPQTHLELCREIASRGIHIICQKPLAPTLQEAREIAGLEAQFGIRIMVHENFRFQPWYRKIHQMVYQDKLIGDRLHTLQFRFRTGDGWPEDAYLSRQPYFREMPRLLIFETGIHFIDTFRYLAGEVHSVYANLRRLNSQIAGEDAGMIFFEFETGAQGLWDANRYNEPNAANPRYTFGDMVVEGNGGTIRLYSGGKITLQPLGEPEEEVSYSHQDINFAGDCVFATQQHFADAMQAGTPFETNVHDYLKNLMIQEAVYESSAKGMPVRL